MANNFVDEARLKKLSTLTRIEIKDNEIEKYLKLLNGYIEVISAIDNIEVDENLKPLNNPSEINLREYPDVVNDGNIAEELMECAPMKIHNYFVVPKIIENK